MSAETSLSRPHLERMFERFARAGFAVLVSNDAGTRSWGQPASLLYLAQLRERAVQLFAFNGNTYTLGYSMGGLPATLSAYKNVFPVAGVLLLDARVNLLDAWHGSDLTRRAEIARALGVDGHDPLPVGTDPLHDYAAAHALALPLFVAGSPDDQTVPFARNGEALFARGAAPDSQLVRLKGPHLGGSHFDGEVVADMLGFLRRVELTAQAKRAPREAEKGVAAASQP